MDKKELKAAGVEALLSQLFHECAMSKNTDKCQLILNLLDLYPRSTNAEYILGFAYATVQIYDAIPNPMER